jgi:hypothetical protein
MIPDTERRPAYDRTVRRQPQKRRNLDDLFARLLALEIGAPPDRIERLRPLRQRIVLLERDRPQSLMVAWGTEFDAVALSVKREEVARW